jgi:O-6-methylguanine DNA methyltransferase
MKSIPHTTLAIPTPDGTFVAHYSAHGLAALDFPSSRPRVRATPEPIPASVRKWHAQTTRAVQAILSGRTPGELPPLDLSEGTDFQRRTWEELTWTPLGETRSYGEIGRALRKPKASRAVGAACGANPVPLLIPCHRVLAANGKLGGFSGGLEWKRKLLEREGRGLKFENRNPKAEGKK